MTTSATCGALGELFGNNTQVSSNHSKRGTRHYHVFGHQIPPPLRTNGRGYGNRGHRNQIPRKDVSHIRTRQLPWAVTLLVTDDDKPKGHIFTSRSQSLVMLHLCLLPLWILLEPSKYSLKWTPHRAGTDPKVIQKVTDDPGPGRDDCVES